ncbi:MAG: hypothetical protein ABI333_05290 [bacterium]
MSKPLLQTWFVLNAAVLLLGCPSRGVQRAAAERGEKPGVTPLEHVVDLKPVAGAPARVLPVSGGLTLLRTRRSADFGHGARASRITVGAGGRSVVADGWVGPGDRAWGVAVIEPFSGKVRRYERLVALDVNHRYAVVRQAQRVWLVDLASGTAEDLSLRGADPDDDRASPGSEYESGLWNHGRQASFGPLGRTLTYIRNSPERVVLRELKSGKERVFALKPRQFVWRAEPTDRGGVRVFVVGRRRAFLKAYVPPDPKLYRHACGTLKHRRYEAMRVTAEQVELLPDGRRVSRGPAQGAVRVHRLGGGFHVLRAELFDSLLRRVQLPKAWGWHVPPAYFIGEGRVLYSGGAGAHLYTPRTGRVVRLPADDVKAGFGLVRPHYDAKGRAWAHLFRMRVDKERTTYVRQGRLSIRDGQIEWTPFHEDRFEAPVKVFQRWFARSPWQMGSNAHGVFALHVGTGELRWQRFPRFGVRRGSGQRAGARGKAQWHWVVAGERRGYYASAQKPLEQGPDGCTLESAAGRRQVDQGPWRLRCPVTP